MTFAATTPTLRATPKSAWFGEQVELFLDKDGQLSINCHAKRGNASNTITKLPSVDESLKRQLWEGSKLGREELKRQNSGLYFVLEKAELLGQFLESRKTRGDKRDSIGRQIQYRCTIANFSLDILLHAFRSLPEYRMTRKSLKRMLRGVR